MKKNTWHYLDLLTKNSNPVNSQPEILVGQYIVPNFVSNSIAIKLTDNEFILVSPGEPLIDAWPEEWRSDKTHMHIIMPNSFHYMGVKAWQEAFPQHTLYASQHAIARLIKKGVAKNKNDIVALESKQPPLPEHYSFLFPPGHRASDVWLKKYNENDNSSIWITCDSFLNYERMSNQPFARAMQKLLGAAPGLKMSQVVKWLILDNKNAFKQWVLKQLEEDRPATLIPSHGEVRHDPELPTKIHNLILDRL